VSGDPRTTRSIDEVTVRMTTDYESLRNAVVRGAAGQPLLGRAVIERAGMAAWMEASAAVPIAPVTVPCGEDLAASVEGGEAVRILAGMALAVIGADR
jgi:hypothetical protein